MGNVLDVNQDKSACASNWLAACTIMVRMPKT